MNALYKVLISLASHAMLYDHVKVNAGEPGDRSLMHLARVLFEFLVRCKDLRLKVAIGKTLIFFCEHVEVVLGLAVRNRLVASMVQGQRGDPFIMRELTYVS